MRLPAAHQPGRSQHLFFNPALTGLLSLLTVLVLLEVMLHVVAPSPGKQLDDQPDPRFGWANIPGFRGYWSAWPEYGDVPVRINSRGLRDDREIPYEKPPGTFRIFVVGDSFTEQKNLSREQSFPYLLEQMLNRDGGATKFEVLNAAVAGFATDQEVLMYEIEGTRYHADLVLVGFFGLDDVADSYRYSAAPQLFQKPFFELRDGVLNLTGVPVKIDSRATAPHG